VALKRVSARQREAVVLRAHGCCEYCLSQERFATERFSIEHIVPREQGGTNDPANLALSCQGCNNHKSTRTEVLDPATGNVVPLYHPRQQSWRAHFGWSDDFTLVVGLTPTGRATVDALHLNRPGLVNLRRMLRAGREHPPLHPQE
jgi:hypothetical protein